MPPPPMDRTAAMPLVERLGVVIRTAAGLLPGDVGRHLLAMISPEALTMIAVVVALWAGSHFVGAGEVADVLLLWTGWIAIGTGALKGTEQLVAFALSTFLARRTADLDRAAHELADAVTILGIDVALGLLFRGRPKKTFSDEDMYGKLPPYRGFAGVMPKGGPTAMYKARLSFTKDRFTGQGGTQESTNIARVGRNFVPEVRSAKEAARELRKTVYHERVHQRLTQAFSLLGRPGVYIKLGAYKRSFILRYIEEAAAEAYGLYKIGGARSRELTAIQFPLNGYYGITLAKMGHEAHGILLGPVVVGGSTFIAYYGLIDRD